MSRLESTQASTGTDGRSAKGSLRRQLILWNVVSIALLLGGLGLVSRYIVLAFMIRSVDRELDRGVEMFIRPPRFGVGPGPPGEGPRPELREGGPPPDQRGAPAEGPPEPGPPRGERGGRGGRGGHGFRPPDSANPFHPHLYTPEGGSFDASDTRPVWDPAGLRKGLAGQATHETVTFEGEPLRVVSMPGYNPDRRKGATQNAYPLREVYRAVAGLDTALLLLIPVGLISAGWMGSALTNRILRRVQQMSHAAGSIGAQNIAGRLPVAGNDEFAELAETFNGLLGRLELGYREQEQLLQLQRRFTADASHELKTPLTIVKGSSSLALTRASTDEVSRKTFQEIDQAAQSMARLVQDLLLLARSDEGQLGREKIEMLVSEVLQTARTQATRGDAEIEICVDPEDLTIRGNEAELVRLFRNLFDNAVRHSKKGASVSVRAIRVEDRLEVTVADRGSGIPPEHLSHLGERFYRIDTSRSRIEGGSGLGLSICKSIAEAHGGSIAFESVIGKGTVVRVRLPISS